MLSANVVAVAVEDFRRAIYRARMRQWIVSHFLPTSLAMPASALLVLGVLPVLATLTEGHA
jgi:hypothetical protein